MLEQVQRRHVWGLPCYFVLLVVTPSIRDVPLLSHLMLAICDDNLRRLVEELPHLANPNTDDVWGENEQRHSLEDNWRLIY